MYWRELTISHRRNILDRWAIEKKQVTTSVRWWSMHTKVKVNFKGVVGKRKTITIVVTVTSDTVVRYKTIQAIHKLYNMVGDIAGLPPQYIVWQKYLWYQQKETLTLMLSLLALVLIFICQYSYMLIYELYELSKIYWLIVKSPPHMSSELCWLDACPVSLMRDL